MTSEAQKKAVKKYQEKSKRISIRFNPPEMELWEYLQKQPNKQGYIKSLIKKDMEGK